MRPRSASRTWASATASATAGRGGATATGRCATSLADAGRRPAAAAARPGRRPDARSSGRCRTSASRSQPGEVVGIIGRNGAGKSHPAEDPLADHRADRPARVELRGRVGSLLEVGTGFHPELTGRENIYLNGAILGMSRREIARKFDEIVAFAEVEQFLDTPVKRYSSGMYVRLAFAVAAHLEPEILIVDEVLAVGDAAFQKKCLGKMERRRPERPDGPVRQPQHGRDPAPLQPGDPPAPGPGRADGPPAEAVRDYLSDAYLASSVSLQDWHDRITNGAARIVRFEIADGDGQPTTSIPVGGTVRFRLVADFFQPLVNPCFGVLVYTATGLPMLDLRSVHAGLRVGRVHGTAEVEVSVDNLGLYPGEYLLSPWITDDGNQDVDWVRHCCTLRVHPAPGPFGDLKLDARFGSYYVSSDWCKR